MAVNEEIKVSVDASDAKKGADSLEKSLAKSFIGANVALGVLNKSFDLMVAQFGHAVKLAVDYERTNLKLTAALKNQNLEVSKNQAALNKQSAALQTLTGISDETLRTLQALAINMGVNVEKADEFTRAAIALSNTTGQDATQSMRQLVKTLSGLKGELGESVPQIAALTAEELKAGKAASVLNEALGENLTLLTKGISGSTHGLTVAWDDFAEALGKSASKSLLVKQGIDDMSSALTRLSVIIDKQKISELFAQLAKNAITFGGMGGIDDILTNLSKDEDRTGQRNKKGQLIGSIDPQTGEMGVDDTVTGGPASKTAGGSFKMDALAVTGRSPAAMAKAAAERQRRRDKETADLLGGIRGDGKGGAKKTGETLTDIENERAARIAKVLEGIQEQGDNERALQKFIDDQKVSDAEKLQKDLDAIAEKGKDRAIEFGVAAGGAIADVFTALASGQEIQLEAMVKDFLLAQGNMLMAEGWASILRGSLMLLNPLQAAQGAATIGIGGAMIAAGGIMTGGAAAIQTPSSGAGGSAGAGGFTPTAAGQLNDPSQRQGSGDVTINIVGDLSDNDALRIQRAMDRSSGRGFG